VAALPLKNLLNLLNLVRGVWFRTSYGKGAQHHKGKGKGKGKRKKEKGKKEREERNGNERPVSFFLFQGGLVCFSSPSWFQKDIAGITVTMWRSSRFRKRKGKKGKSAKSNSISAATPCSLPHPAL